MGKFDNVMLCSDLDGTLLDSDKNISQKNRSAIEYFKSEGGAFAIVTGRAPRGSEKMAGWVKPNIPSVLFNGAGIYDFEKKELLWGEYLDTEAVRVVRLVEKNFPHMGLIVCTDTDLCINEDNRCVKSYYRFERNEAIVQPYPEIKKPWKKALFITDADDVDKVRRIIAESEFADKYSFMQSSPYYYEILPKGIDKGKAILKLREIAGLNDKKLVCIGDSENDVSMVKRADVGIAVENALDCVKAAADVVLTVNNDEDALADAIYNVL